MTKFLPQRTPDHLGVLKALLQGALHRRSDRPGNPFKIFCNSQKWYSFAIPCWHYYDLTSQKIAFRAWRNVHNTETFWFQDKPYDVFLSYSHEDEAWVEQVHCALMLALSLWWTISLEMSLSPSSPSIDKILIMASKTKSLIFTKTRSWQLAWRTLQREERECSIAAAFTQETGRLVLS